MTKPEFLVDSNLTCKLTMNSNVELHSQLVRNNNNLSQYPSLLYSSTPQLSPSFEQDKKFRKGPPPTSCDLCKRWKVKCNRISPKCNTCIKNGSDCTYNYASKYWEQQKKIKSTRKFPFSLPLIKKPEINNTHFFGNNFANPCQTPPPTQINQLLETMYKRNPSLKHSIARYFIKLHPNLAPSLSEYIHGSPITNQHNELIPKLKDGALQDLGHEISNMIQRQLIHNYFRYLNDFYPLVNEDEFMEQLNNNRNDAPFLALVNVACMIGLGYSTALELTSKLAPALGARARFYLKKCFNRPSLTVVQACILLSHYCNTDEDDGVSQSNWIFLGLAQQMSLQLGLNIYNSRRSISDQLLCWRVWCILAVDDILIEHCMGLPASLSVEFGFLSPQYISPPTKLTDRNPSLRFLRTVMIHYRLLPFVARLRLRFSRVAQVPSLDRFDKSCQEVDMDVIRSPEFLQFRNMTYSLEQLYHQWYQFIPDFVCNSSPQKLSRRQYIMLCDPNDRYAGLLMVFYFSTLVEMYRPLIAPGLTINNCHVILKQGRVSVPEFAGLNPLEKATIAAHLGVQLFQQSGVLLADLGHPYMWYCVMNITFIHLYVLSRFPPPHPIAISTRSNLTYLAVLTQYGSQKCALIRDIFYTLDPLLRAYRST